MNKQKFFTGDRVRIRRFDEIDTSDLGDIRHNKTHCFGISSSETEMLIAEREYYYIAGYTTYKNCHVYALSINDFEGERVLYSWAQGMLDYYEEEELPTVELGDLCELLGVS